MYGSLELPGYTLALVQSKSCRVAHGKAYPNYLKQTSSLSQSGHTSQSSGKLNQTFKERQEYNFNKRHQVQDLPSLPDDKNVWVTSSGEPIQGRVIEQGDTPRSYLVDLPSGQIRRNCHQLKPMPDLIENDSRPNRHNVQSKQPELS